MAGGFILKNQLTDFSFAPEEDCAAVANRVEPGKRPRSSMAPTIVLKDGKPAYALGSPGGSSIIPYVATTLIGLIDWKLDMQAAISMPHMLNRFGVYELEAGTNAEGFADDLQALGYETKIGGQNSGLHSIAIRPEGLSEGPTRAARASRSAIDYRTRSTTKESYKRAVRSGAASAWAGLVCS